MLMMTLGLVMIVPIVIAASVIAIKQMIQRKIKMTKIYKKVSVDGIDRAGLLEPQRAGLLEPQVKAWISGYHEQYEFWKTVSCNEGECAGLGKTVEQAAHLSSYFEGCYDAALKFRNLISQKAIQFEKGTTTEI